MPSLGRILRQMALRRSDKSAALGRIPLFADLSKKELASVAALTTELAVEADTTLVTQGEVGRQAMVLIEGSAVVRKNGRKVAELGRGDVVGEMSLIEHVPRNATVVTTAPSIMLVMDAREFASLMTDQPKVALKILKTVARRFAELDTKAV